MHQYRPAGTGDSHAWDVVLVLRIFLIIPALIFGIIGLIKSAMTKNIIGIILSCVGLLVSLYLIYGIIRLLTIVSGYPSYCY